MNSFHLNSQKCRQRMLGFTLIELMIAVVVIGILSAVALPSYRSYVIRGDRAAAQAEMMEIANREQQYFLAQRTYAAKADLTTSGYAPPSNVSSKYNWDVTVTTDGAPTYTITFTPTGSQASDGVLTLNSAGVKTPSDKW